MRNERKSYMRRNLKAIKELSRALKIYDGYENAFEIYRELANKAIIQIKLRKRG